MIGLKNYYWYWEGALPKKTCEQIIKFCKKENKEKAITQAESENLNFKDTARNSDIRWINSPWIYNEIMPFVHSANKSAGWNFDIDWCESIQFTEYKSNQYYGWHADNYSEPFGDKYHRNYRGKVRKISVTVNLSDPKNYDGGDFQIDTRNSQKGNAITTVKNVKTQGSILVFPSFIFHQVTPVIRGERDSLVIWNIGSPWK